MTPFVPSRPLSRRSVLRLGAYALGAVGLADIAWIEPRGVRIETWPLPTGQSGRPVRVAHISDLHLDAFDSYFQKISTLLADLHPDLIVLTGDYLEEQRNIRGVVEFFRSLKAGHGIFAIQGNWEYWSRLEGENLRRHFLGAGVKLLIDERADVEINGQRLSLFGLDYPSSSDQLQRLQREIDPSRFNLLLSHVPAFAHEHLLRPVGLVLCGHTHGGQFRLPLLPPLYLPRFSGRFVAGHYRVGPFNTPLYVNRGIGTSVLPLRLGCRPEITLIELIPGTPAATAAPASGG